MKNNLINDERGDTNFVSIIILIGVVIAGVFIFRPYIADAMTYIVGLFS